MHAHKVRDAAFGAAVLAVGLFAVYHATTITTGFSYDVVGPTLFPFMVAGGLVACGLAILAGAMFGAAREEPAEVHDYLPVVLISVGMLAQMLLLTRLGWIPATAISFAIAAWAFGSRRPLFNLAVGLAVAAIVYLAFSLGLGLRLPTGIFSQYGALFG